MKLQDALPQRVQVNGRWHRVDLDFRNVLRMMDVLADDGLTAAAREVLAGRCISKHPCRGLVQAVQELINGNETREIREHKKVTSFAQDAGMIRAAFLQAYGIDLWTAKLHWMQFIELLRNLPEDTQYMAVVGIRARPMPRPTKYNREEREWLRNAKAQYALTVTEEERERTYQRGVKDVFAGLMSMAQKG